MATKAELHDRIAELESELAAVKAQPADDRYLEALKAIAKKGGIGGSMATVAIKG